MYGKRYAADPRWIVARYPGKCAKCGEPITKGERIFYYPNGKAAYSGQCAEACSRDFEAAAFDEDVMGGGF